MRLLRPLLAPLLFFLHTTLCRGCRETGCPAYDSMLVLDADSLMTGDTVKRLILRMQESPKLGILQSVVLPARSRTIFARAMQFTISRSMPLFARGVYWFLGPESVYWGHNALIRVAPFMRHGNVPEMPGKPPRGGTIMSQDIVEARPG